MAQNNPPVDLAAQLAQLTTQLAALQGEVTTPHQENVTLTNANANLSTQVAGIVTAPPAAPTAGAAGAVGGAPVAPIRFAGTSPPLIWHRQLGSHDKNTSNEYITWKYWHVPYLHAKSMGIIAAYNMYNECCDGLLDASWAIPKKRRMGFTEFRIKLSEQMLKYDPRDNRYAGDHKFRRFTQHHKLRRGIGSANSMGTNDDEVFSNDGLTLEVFKRARELPRFCTTVEELNNHFHNVVK